MAARVVAAIALLLSCADARTSMGAIQFFAGNSPPPGWLFCNGALLSVSTNPELFALLGTTYGGDGTTTFSLPDLRGRVPVGEGAGPGLISHVLGELYGANTVTLVNANLPAHSHNLRASSNGPDTSDPAGSVLAGTTTYYAGGTDVTMAAASIEPIGGSQPFAIDMPSLVLNAMICIDPLGCDGSCDMAYWDLQRPANPGRCLNGSYIANGTLQVVGSVVLQVPLKLDPSAVLQLGANVSITVNGCVSLDGELILQLDSLPETDVNITSLYYECVVGTFRTIDTVAPSQKDCNAPSVSPTYGSSSLVILLSPSSHCGRGLSTGAIIGIAVGGGIVLIALVMLVVLVLLRRSRNPFVKRIFSRSARRPPPSSRGVVY